MTYLNFPESFQIEINPINKNLYLITLHNDMCGHTEVGTIADLCHLLLQFKYALDFFKDPN